MNILVTDIFPKKSQPTLVQATKKRLGIDTRVCASKHATPLKVQTVAAMPAQSSLLPTRPADESSSSAWVAASEQPLPMPTGLLNNGGWQVVGGKRTGMGGWSMVGSVAPLTATHPSRVGSAKEWFAHRAWHRLWGGQLQRLCVHVMRRPPSPNTRTHTQPHQCPSGETSFRRWTRR